MYIINKIILHIGVFIRFMMYLTIYYLHNIVYVVHHIIINDILFNYIKSKILKIV